MPLVDWEALFHAHKHVGGQGSDMEMIPRTLVPVGQYRKCRDRDHSQYRRAVSLAGSGNSPRARRMWCKRGHFPRVFLTQELINAHSEFSHGLVANTNCRGACVPLGQTQLTSMSSSSV